MALKLSTRLSAPLLFGAHVACSLSPAIPEQESRRASLITEGISRFYATAERLLNDEAPSEETWAELFAAPGYAQIDVEEGRSRWMPELIELAYRPSLRAKLEARLEQEDVIGMVLLPNLALAIEQRALIDATVVELARPEKSKEIMGIVSQWLPEGVIESVEAPELYLIVLDGDSKALPTGIVLDVVGLAMTGVDYTKLLVAHEFHHHYRRQLATVNLDAVPEDVRLIIHLMEQAETEGIADLIDKREMIFAPGGLPANQLAHPGFEWM